MEMTVLQNNFSSGELSPMMEGAVGSVRYQSGLSVCENFLPLRQGGVRRRPGSHYVGVPKNTGQSRLIDFQAIDGNYYILEFTQVSTAKIIRIWKPDFTLVMDGLNPLELTSPYSVADFPLLKYATVKGVLYLVHPSYAPRTITLSGTTWSIATPTFTGDRTFAATNKYPSVITFKGGRLYLGGTNDEPNAIFASMTPVAATGVDRFTNFTLGTSADDAIYLQESDMYGTHLHWLITQKRVVAGTDRSIWMDSGAAATPSTFDMNIVSFTGSSDVQAKISENIIVYAGRGGNSLHAMIFSEESGGFIDIDLTRDADHILAGGITDFAIMSFPEPIIWVVRSDGILCSCTVDQKSNIIAWARHPMGEGAVVEAVTVGVCTEADDVWIVVKRGALRTIECIRFCDLYTGSIEDAWFVDCGIQVLNSPASPTVSTLFHLIGYDVDALGDGSPLPRKTVPAGAELTYDRDLSKVNIGIPYESKMVSMRPELPSNGTSQGKLRRLERMTIRFYQSLGGQAGTPVSLVPIIDATWGISSFGTAQSPVSGDKALYIAGGNTTDGRVELLQDAPVPFNVLAVMTRYSVMEV